MDHLTADYRLDGASDRFAGLANTFNLNPSVHVFERNHALLLLGCIENTRFVFDPMNALFVRKCKRQIAGFRRKIEKRYDGSGVSHPSARSARRSRLAANE